MAGPAGGAPAEHALAGAFGLDADESDALGAMLRTAAGSLGLDGDRLSDALADGRPLGVALGLPPRLGEVLYARAHRWFEAGRPDRAEPLFRALCTLDGTVADYWVGHGVCLRLSERLDLAELAFATAARLRPDWSLPFFHLAEIFARRGRFDAALDALSAFETRLDPEDRHLPLAEAARLRAVLVAHRAGAGGDPAR